MKKRHIRASIYLFVVLIISIFALTSCSNGKAKTLYQSETSSSGCSNTNKKTKTDWIKDKISEDVNESVSAYYIWVSENDAANYETLKAKEDEVKLKGVTYTKDGDDYQTTSYLSNLKNLITSYAIYANIANEKDENKIESHFQVAQIKAVRDTYYTYIDNIINADAESIDDLTKSINGQAGCFDTSSEGYMMNELDKEAECDDAYRLAALYILRVDTILTYLEPIVFKGKTVGEFFSHLWNNLFVFPVAWLIYIISKLCGGFYAVGLIIATILVRTIGWPIYGKTNDMTNKMAELQPELQKIQDKYAGRDDPDSKRMMQAEQAQIYRKNKVGVGGCILPFLQFPIFMAIFRAISRIPYTIAIPGTMYVNNWAVELNPKLFFINLFENRNIGGVGQLVGVIVLALLVIATQVLSQLLSKRRQKLAKEKSQEDIPAYRRQAYNQQQNQTNSTMNMMMWMMIVMMGLFVWTSKAGLGVYWLIGNLYSTGQAAINGKQQEKRKAKKAEEAAHNRGIYTVHLDDDKKSKKKKNKK